MDWISILLLKTARISVTASILIVFIFLVRALLKNWIKSKYIYFLWIIIMIRMLLPFGIESSFSIENILFDDEIVSHYDNVLEFNRGSVESEDYEYYFDEVNNAVSIPKGTDNLISILTVVWILGIISVLFIPFVTYFTLVLEFRKLEKCKDENILKASRDACRSLSINNKFRILESHLVESPALIGVFRPSVVLPVKHDDSYDCLYKIFLHEYIHYMNRHLLYQWIFWIVKAFHWFNPLVWCAHEIMKRDAENMCDEKAVEILDSRKEYADLILSIAQYGSDRNFMINTVGFSYRKSELYNRIKNISTRKKNPLMLRIALFVLIMVAIPVFYTSYSVLESSQKGDVQVRNVDMSHGNDSINLTVESFEYESDKGVIYVDMSFELDEEQKEIYDSQSMNILFDTLLIFPSSKDPDIRNRRVQGSVYSMDGNNIRFLFELGDYGFEKYKNPVFRMEQILLERNIEELFYEVVVDDIPLEIVHDETLHILINDVSFEDGINMKYQIKKYGGIYVDSNIYIYGRSEGRMVKPYSGGGVSEEGETGMKNESSYAFEAYEKIDENMFNLGIAGYEMRLVNYGEYLDFTLDMKDYKDEK